MFMIIAQTITASTMQTAIVPTFAPIHDSICILLSELFIDLSLNYFDAAIASIFLFLTVSFVASLYGLTSI
jgi:hypothetical protein